MFAENGEELEFEDCTFTANFAVKTGGAIYNSGTEETIKGCLFSSNSASFFRDTGGAYANDGGTSKIADSTFTQNDHRYGYGGAASVISGSASMTRCRFNQNHAWMGGGALHLDGGQMILNDCRFVSNYETGGESGYEDEGDVAHVVGSGVISFYWCTFAGGPNDSPSCGMHATDTGVLEFYYTQDWSISAVCSLNPFLIYNSNASIPMSASEDDGSYVSAISCNDPSAIGDYCAYDCVTQVADMGISCRSVHRRPTSACPRSHTRLRTHPHACARALSLSLSLSLSLFLSLSLSLSSCTADGNVLDPHLVDVYRGECDNSPQLTLPAADLTVATTKTKTRSNATAVLVFSNSGDKMLNWRLKPIAGSDTSHWTVYPVSGNLSACGLETVDISLDTWDLPARADAYVLELELHTNSLQDSIRNVYMRGFVSAELDMNQTFVTLDNSEAVVASGEVSFQITSIDYAGLVSQDASLDVYSASLHRKTSDDKTTCRVSFVSETGRHGGTCSLPELQSGDFDLSVENSIGVSVRQLTVSVTACPASYFFDDSPRDEEAPQACVRCPEGAFCKHGGVALSTMEIRPKWWRVDKESSQVRPQHHT